MNISCKNMHPVAFNTNNCKINGWTNEDEPSRFRASVTYDTINKNKVL